MRTSLQTFPDISVASVDTLIVAHSEANNELADINALLLAIELSLVEKLKDLDLSKLAFDKTLRLIEIAKSNVELAQDFHKGALSEITGAQHQFDELKNSIAHLDSHQESEETKVGLNCLAPANSTIYKTLNTNFEKLDINGVPEKKRLSIPEKGFKHDERR